MQDPANAPFDLTRQERAMKHESMVYQFHNMLILQPPPMPPIPPIPPDMLPVDEGLAIPAVPVGSMPDMAIEAEDIIVSWFIAMIVDGR